MTVITDPEPTTSPAVMALSHAIRRDVVDCVARGIETPKEMAERTGHPLGVVAYHVRMLRDYGVLELARSEARRGALQHFYGFSAEAVTAFEDVRDLANAAIRSARSGPTVSTEEVDRG
jgi:predicted transcriptional regulator